MKKAPITIMGIDFGIANTIYLAFNNNNSFYTVKSAPVVKSERRLIKNPNNPYEIVDNYNYQTALFVVNKAIRHNVKIIHMEELSGTGFTRNLFYYDLQRQIQFLANERFINVRYINRYKSSQKCSWCGFTDKANRSQSMFCCLECGFITYADYNAAKNIANDSHA